jgi:hypothetical protein
MIASSRLEDIQASNQLLHTQLELALARIEHNVQRNKELAERISRSPRAIKTIQALEAAIAIFGQNAQEPEYQISEYATEKQVLEAHTQCAPGAHHGST